MQHVRLISDFNIEVLERYLSNLSGAERLRVAAAPFGQVMQQLSAPDSDRDEIVVIWTRPESVIPTYRAALALEPVDHGRILAEVLSYANVVASKAARAKYLFHAAWTTPRGHPGYGMLDYKQGVGLADLIARMNLSLTESVAEHTNAFVLNAEAWLRHGGPRPSLPKMWFASKVPFKNVVFEQAAKDILAAIDGLEGKARKLVIVDLDDTLWGGVVGETGWQHVRLGGHDFVGEAFVEFQRSLKALANRGIQLGIVSKNDERTALEAIDRNPEMLLRRADFAGWRINWGDKVENIVSLAEELRLGLDSTVFIDDNPAERGRVREALGDRVLVPEWPVDPTEFSAALSELRCFDTPAISQEDRARAGMYAMERERRSAAESFGSIDGWLASLELVVTTELLSAANLARASQLFNKTNQLNLATRRLSEEELKRWADASHRRVWTFRVADRYGDSGLTGIISVEVDGDSARIVDFVMSCRVMGRRVEEAMVATAVEFVRAHTRAGVITATFVPTERNRPCLEFWRRSGFQEREEHQFCWETAQAYLVPHFMRLVGCAADGTGEGDRQEAVRTAL